MTKVVREFSFEAAHMLSNYDGKCNSLHGHSYRLQVAVIDKTQLEGNEQHMVMDFGTLKTIVQEEVLDKLDHALIVSAPQYREDAETDLFRWAVQWGKRYYILDTKCTVEMMAAHIQGLVSNRLPGAEVHVRMWETEKSFTEVK